MDAALVVITLLSLGLTGALVVYATRLHREAQQRSEARVAALATDIRGHHDSGPAFGVREVADVRPVPARESSDHLIRRTDVATETGHVARFRVQQGDEGPRIDADDFRRSVIDSPASEVSAAGGRERGSATESLFESREPGGSPVRRLVAFGAGGAALVFVVAALLGGGGAGDANAPAPADAGTATVAGGAPLELLALQHERAESTLTISGVIRNPGGSQDRRGVAAVVFLFDRDGTFVTSGRAEIDYQTLAGGDESPFIVTIPNAGSVGRYRVSFRTESAVIPHVDRRQPATTGA